MDPTPPAHPTLAWSDLLPLRPTPAIPPQGHSRFRWGDPRVHGVALRTAACALAHGLQVAVVDAGLAFHVRPIVAMAQACRIAADTFLRRVHIVRALTCCS